jgi:hypothetical protein
MTSSPVFLIKSQFIAPTSLNSIIINGIPFTINGSTPESMTITIPSDIPLPEAKANKEYQDDGCKCKKCGDFYQYAVPNQQDGTLICYNCRT